MNGVTYAELHARAAAVADALAGSGIRAGDRVATTVAGLDFAVLLHALPLLGAVLVPLNTRLTRGERDAVLDSAQPSLVLDSLPEIDETVDMRRERRSRVDPGDVFVVIHTSGTTGRPKPVELTYGNFHASAVANAQNLGVQPDDRWLCCMPLFHVGGLSILTRSAINQTEAVIHNGFEVDKVKKALADEQITLISLVPTQLSRLLDAGLTAPHLRAILLGGGPIPKYLLET